MSNYNSLKDAFKNLNVSKPYADVANSAQTKLSSNQAQLKISSVEASATSQNEITSEAEIVFIENSDGETHIPHKMLELILKQIGSRVELSVLLCLIRFTLGFQRSKCELSQGFLARWTGIQPQNVRRGLKGLIENGFVKILESGTVKQEKALYLIPLVESYFAEKELSLKQAELKLSSAQNELSQNAELSSNQAESCAQNELRTELILSSKKEINKINKTSPPTSPNTEIAPETEFLRAYFFSIRAPGKREREEEAFVGLKKSFSESEIESALRQVQKKGTLTSGEKCVMPLTYLLSAMDEVLKRVPKGQSGSLNSSFQQQQKHTSTESSAHSWLPTEAVQKHLSEFRMKQGVG